MKQYLEQIVCNLLAAIIFEMLKTIVRTLF